MPIIEALARIIGFCVAIGGIILFFFAATLLLQLFFPIIVIGMIVAGAITLYKKMTGE